MFLPTTPEECANLGWRQLDVILVSGDSYVDTPFNGTAVIGKVLLQAGFKVGVIAQPDVHSAEDITRLGEPALFWGVSAGAVDSMVANYTATRKKRRDDDNTPGGINNRRPDRAVMVYTNLIRRWFKNTRPIILGGIEASLRRVAHYDFWSDRVRGSILLDAKADLLFYGMAEKGVVELARCMQTRQDFHSIRGLCYVTRQPTEGFLELPSFETVAADKHAFIEMFHQFYRNNDPISARGLVQRHGDRYLVQNPPAPTPSQGELDRIYDLEFERQQHPYYERQGKVKSLETIQFSIQTHRGCYGECNFCAIAVHEGRTVSWRSQPSVIREAEKLTALPGFKGIIQDIGGPTANMYGFECAKKLKSGSCAKKRCLYPQVCNQLKVDHTQQIDLLRKMRQVKSVRKAFVASGIRYDMVLADRPAGVKYLKDIIRHHVSGQMKVAPEHTENKVLRLMGKPDISELLKFKELFEHLNNETGKPQFLTYYLIAAHPGCSEEDMMRLRTFTSLKLKIHPEQVQVFTPTPSTYSSLMYYTEMDPFSGEKLFVEKESGRKERQKRLVVEKNLQFSGNLMADDSRLDFFAACLPGVEPFLASEMAELNLIKPDHGDPGALYRTGDGGIAFTGSSSDLYRANLWLRTANRVLLRLGSFHAVKFVELRRKAGNLPWENFLVPGQPVAMRTTCKHSKLYHSGGVSERVIYAIADRLGRAPVVCEDQENALSPQLVLVRFENDHCTISLDTSGEGLHRRGYRQAVAKAPLRETLAAAVLIASGWDRQTSLLDPFCGSGVIPIEAALLATRTAPGLNRRFSFMDWPDFSRAIFKNEMAMAASQIQSSETMILGSDRDAGAVAAARENAERACVARLIQFSQAAISNILPPAGHGWVVTNPPYGVRISGSRDLRDLYAQFGKVLKARCPGWHAAFLCNDDRLASLTQLNFEKGVSLNNGGIPVKLSIGTVPAE